MGFRQLMARALGLQSCGGVLGNALRSVLYMGGEGLPKIGGYLLGDPHNRGL